jgi:predicted O-methyltransferase YrrM
MNLSSLALNPSYVAPSAWWQHVPIAHWLVAEIKPNRIVELGTHYGVSFFSFCEAAEKYSPDTFLYAIDTWEGDAHAGWYSEDVFKRVLEHWASYHRTRARLIRSTFDDAATYFERCSIDILHIDGLHTYEAVKHDLETWLPFLKDDSIVLFHDINVREKDFGVWRLWQELKLSPEYETAETLNGHGLGILIKGNKYRNLLEGFSSILGLLTSRGQLLEKLAELTPGGSFDKPAFEIQIEQARAEAEQARADAEQARADAEQARADAEQARADAEQARADAEQARAEAEQARADAEQAKAAANEKSSELKKLQESTTWKATKPVRSAMDTWKELFKSKE